jgi:hypothetical protein
MRRGATTLRITVAGEDVDMAARVELQRVRIEILTGERASEVFEEVHAMTVWTPVAWSAAVAAAGLRIAAVYDGEDPGRPAVEPGRSGTLLWHELVRSER